MSDDQDEIEFYLGGSFADINNYIKINGNAESTVESLVVEQKTNDLTRVTITYVYPKVKGKIVRLKRIYEGVLDVTVDHQALTDE